MEDASIVVLCTAPDLEVGARLGKGLVRARLAACVNLIPNLRSFYRWEGEIQDDSEVQLVIKTHSGRMDALEAWLQEHHPYDVPEILALPVAAGSKSYLDWLQIQSSP